MRRQILQRATAIAAVLAFIVAGSGQAIQAVACPSHEDARAGARHAEKATPSDAGRAHEAHAQEADQGSRAPHHGSAEDEVPDSEHGDHACTCVGACCQSAVTESSASEGLTRRLGFRIPLALQITSSTLPTTAQTAYVLPFATAPPST